MSRYQDEMNRVVSGFVQQVTELARIAARDMIDQALSGRGRLVAKPGRGRGARRGHDDLERLSELFVAHVSKHPGQRIEQINKQLGTSTKQLALPIRKLIAERAVTRKGSRRATMYFAAK